MALQKQMVPMPVTGGINTGVADILRDPAQLSRGDNIEQIKTGEITKRKGFDEVLANHGSLAQATGKAAFAANNALIVAPQSVPLIYRAYAQVNGTSSGILSLSDYLSTMQEWTFDIRTFLTTSSAVMDSTVGPGSFLFVASGGVIYKIDSQMNIVPYSASDLGYTTSAILGRVRFINGTHAVAPVAGVGGRIFNLTGFTSANLGLTFTGTSTTGIFDAIGTGSGGYVLVYDDNANIVINSFNSSNASLGSVTVSRTDAVSANIAHEVGGGSIYVGVARSSGNSELYQITLSTMTLTGTGQTGPCYHLVPYFGGPASTVEVFYTKTTGSGLSSTTTHIIECGQVTGFSVTFSLSFSTTMTPATLQSVPIGTSGNDAGTLDYLTMIAGYQSTDDLNLQNSSALVSWSSAGGEPSFDGLVDQKAPNVNTTLSIANGRYWLPRMAEISTGNYFLPLQSRLANQFTGAASASTFGTIGLFLNRVGRSVFSKPVQAGQNTYIAANSVYVTDGRSYNQLGYPIYPNPVTYALINSGTGVLPISSTYGLATTYEWQDAKGNVIESAPQFSTYTRPASTTFSFQYTAQNPPFQTQNTWRQNFYRTVPDGSIYYLAGSTTSVAATVVDDIAAATLETQKILYTTGGVAENIAPFGVNYIGAAKSRLWTFQKNEVTTLWFSKKLQDNFLPAFSDLLTIEIPESGGSLVGVAQIDDKVIVFKESWCYVLSGDGPTESLTGAWSDPSAISQGIGCTNARSITETPIGVFFQSAEGIYLIDRSLQAQFIGRPILGNGTITSSIYDPVNNKVLFSTASEIWIYYITTSAWYKWTLSGVQDLFILNGSIYASRTSDVLKQGTGYQDDSANYDQVIKLGQYQFAGIQGYQRIYRLLITGAQTTSNSSITVKTYFDGNSTVTDTQTITAVNSVSGNRMAIEVRPSRQKCETMELELSHSANNEGIKVSAVSAEVGTIPAAGRRAATGRAV